MQNVIALILANLPAIIEAGKSGYDFIQSVRAAAQQAGEWTEAQEAEFQAKLAEQTIDPAWQCDPAPVTPPGAGAPEVACANGVKCPCCGKTLISNHPDNCNCCNSQV
jgi:hypothetical protein